MVNNVTNQKLNFGYEPNHNPWDPKEQPINPPVIFHFMAFSEFISNSTWFRIKITVSTM